MKRRDFIAKGIGAGVAAGTTYPLLSAEQGVADKLEQPETRQAVTAGSAPGPGGKLPLFWDQLTSPDFKIAVEQAGSVCTIPIGVLEKHGAQLPLGTDVIRAHEMCRRAAELEYNIIYPDFYAGQIFEARHQPGTIAYSTELMLRMLDETCREISRNGLKKIILVNTHGGNNSFLPYFLQIQMESPRDYAVYLFQLHEEPETQKKITELRKSTTGGHADEIETGEMLVICPQYVRLDQTTTQSGRNLNRLNLPNVTTGISWYSRYPNHYAGQSEGATAELGEVRLTSRSRQLADAVKAIKADATTLRLQSEFFEQSLSPLKTKVWE
ncbi:MAG: creatininase family protein [Tannerellaceae bacterium]|jgi:creatinine amidohydrolase|nr:creatininase family protein [Tannerellaceae bacterium]